MTKFYRAEVGEINLVINHQDLSLIRNSPLCMKQLSKRPSFKPALPCKKKKKEAI